MSRVRQYSGYRFESNSFCIQDYHLLWSIFPDRSTNYSILTLLTRSYNPNVQAHWFGLFRFRSPLLTESQLISIPPGTEMFHFPGLLSSDIISKDNQIQHLIGLPHSEIAGSKVVCTSPTLIAAYHVLRQHSLPRHPPYALSSLAIFFNPSSPTKKEEMFYNNFLVLRTSIVLCVYTHDFSHVLSCQ
jgi:hypothetical protein